MLGGSRALGTADEASDWDIGVYYRGDIDLAPLSRHGDVHAPGTWGRIMNGGAWLSLDGLKVDVLLRDLDVALQWSEQARRGVYEVDALLGYLAGAPTYLLMAEMALSRPLCGRLPAVGDYPPALAETGARRWRFHADFSLTHARMRAERGDVVGAVGQTSKAVMELAHAVACDRRLWVVNEKMLIERTGLVALHRAFTSVPVSARDLTGWVSVVRDALRVTEQDARG